MSNAPNAEIWHDKNNHQAHRKLQKTNKFAGQPIVQKQHSGQSSNRANTNLNKYEMEELAASKRDQIVGRKAQDLDRLRQYMLAGSLNVQKKRAEGQSNYHIHLADYLTKDK